METAISTISVLPSGKKEIALFVETIRHEILMNDKNPLPVLVKLKYIEKTVKEILSDDKIDAHFLKEFQLYEREHTISIDGAELRQGETGVKIDYKASGDLQWIELDEQIKKLTEQRKKRETFLNSIPDEGVTDEKTGLYITRPPKSSTTKVIVTLK
jgi:hypothetical protein